VIARALVGRAIIINWRFSARSIATTLVGCAIIVAGDDYAVLAILIIAGFVVLAVLIVASFVVVALLIVTALMMVIAALARAAVAAAMTAVAALAVAVAAVLAAVMVAITTFTATAFAAIGEWGDGPRQGEWPIQACGQGARKTDGQGGQGGRLQQAVHPLRLRVAAGNLLAGSRFHRSILLKRVLGRPLDRPCEGG
jgi:hypothetical protein